MNYRNAATAQIKANHKTGATDGSLSLFDADESCFATYRRLKTPVWVFDIDRFRIVYANSSACKLWQAHDEAELSDRDLSVGLSPAVARRLEQYQQDFATSDRDFVEQWTLYPEQQPVSIQVAFSKYVLDDGRVGMLCEALEASMHTPDNVRSTEALLHTGVCIALVGLDGNALYMNPPAREVLELSRANLSDVFVDQSEYVSTLTELRRKGEHRVVSQIKTCAGSKWYDITARRCIDAVSGQPAVLISATDVSELKSAKDRARFLAERDQLTGCYNRRYLHDWADQNVTDGSLKDKAVIYFDVDQFKEVNDKHGHAAGDQLLSDLAKRISVLAGSGDVLSRVGGDEFVFVLNGFESIQSLEDHVRKLVDIISEPFVFGKVSYDVSVSMGVSITAGESQDMSSLLKQADIALYESKKNGCGIVTYFTERLGNAVSRRNRIERELRTAIERREFTLEYQPRVNLKTGETSSVEALVRWQHPTEGLVMPGSFISICEDTGLIEQLGQQVLEMGCEQAVDWCRRDIPCNVSLNISPRQFESDLLMDTLSSFAQKDGFPNGKVELEITESMLIGDQDEIAHKLQEITKLGYRIAIDDFGTGYSNLSYILNFPLGCIKLDKSFVSHLPHSGPIVRLILTLARQIGAKTVAEGVETGFQLDWLRGNGCDEVQGYLLSKPKSIESLDFPQLPVN